MGVAKQGSVKEGAWFPGRTCSDLLPTALDDN